ncbi:SGNH/GDSL hydrolase family protein [Negadavirga shengliensis]|uniref:SGNH/GDSL hydrolase family protein n=1 Tax=Negadavirga shengliensis TaxID=1389218 RepID=A0ABV9SZM7_9BACT
MPIKITKTIIKDIRFPTGKNKNGSDAMMMGTAQGYKIALIMLLGLWSMNLDAQSITWYDPLKENNQVIHGQGWQDLGYARLPDEAQPLVREPVWNLSRNATGLLVRFTTNAKKIDASYIPLGRLQMPHMPATGVSGLDLYTKDGKGSWIWVRGNYAFGDTVSYSFVLNDNVQTSREFYLYLPLYNSVKDLRIAVEEGRDFQFIPVSPKEKPITVYGTSIAQGACASRPGMAWTSILSRKLDKPVVNLGFSGNGQLEESLIQYLSEIDSEVYILDCLPNLVREEFTEEEVKKRLIRSVKYLKEKRPSTPILLVEHAGYTDGKSNQERAQAYMRLNEWCKEAYRELLVEGLEEVYLLENEDIALTMDATVDGTHPSDLGMQQQADAVADLLREIL